MSPRPAADVPNAGQRALASAQPLPGRPRSNRHPAPRAGTGAPLAPAGLGLGQLQGRSPACGVTSPRLPGAGTPAPRTPPGTWTPQTLALVFWLFQIFAGSGERHSLGKGPERFLSQLRLPRAP